MSKNELINQRELLFDRIERFYKEEIVLDDHEREICERLELAFSLLQKHRSKNVAIAKYLKIQEMKGNPLAKNTAYSDFKKAELLFVPIHKVSKDLHRIVLIESIDKDIAKLKSKQKVKSEGGEKNVDVNDRLFLQYQDQINKLYELRIKAAGLHQDDPNIPDFSAIQMPDLQVNVSPKVEQLLKALMKSGVVDTTEMIKKYTEDAELIQEQDEEANENN